METTLLLPYLRELRAHNERDWFAATKARRDACKAQFEILLQRLLLEAGQYQQDILWQNPKALQFQMPRDTRFGLDKRPYTPAFRAHLGAAGKLPLPAGYFLCIQPESSFIGGGLCNAYLRDATLQIRKYMAAHPKKWEAVLTHPDFAGRFEIKGEKLQRVPKEYPAEHPLGEYLKHKCWFVEYTLPDSVVEDAEALVLEAAAAFRAMHPLNAFLNEATKGLAISW